MPPWPMRKVLTASTWLAASAAASPVFGTSWMVTLLMSMPASFAYAGNSSWFTEAVAMPTFLVSRSFGDLIGPSMGAMIDTSVCWWKAATALTFLNLPLPLLIMMAVRSSEPNWAVLAVSFARLAS